MNTLLLTAALMAPAADLSGGYDKPAKVKAAPARDYAACLKYVEDVGDCLLCVGMPKDFFPRAYYQSFAVDSLPGIEPGVYLCTVWDDFESAGRKKLDKPVMHRKRQYEPKAVAPEVRPLTPFPDAVSERPAVSARPPLTVAKTGSVVTDHTCPKCGAGPWYGILSWNSYGTHNHRCEACSTVFSH